MTKNTAQMSPDNTEPTLLPEGQHPGFSQLPAQDGVFRCELSPRAKKKKAEHHADYAGVLTLSGGAKAHVLVWVNSSGSLGLRLELIKNKERAPARQEESGSCENGQSIGAP